MNALPARIPPDASDEEILLDVLRDLLSQYVDLQDRAVEPSTKLADIGVDSLTAAEVLFALEDRLGVRMDDPPELPVTVGDVLDYALPYLGERRSAAVTRH